MVYLCYVILIIVFIFLIFIFIYIHLIPPRPFFTFLFLPDCVGTSDGLVSYIHNYIQTQLSKSERLTWVETKTNIKRSDGGIILCEVNELHWVDDMRRWPRVSYGDIFYYLVRSLGVDGSAMKNFKSTEAYQRGIPSKSLTKEALSWLSPVRTSTNFHLRPKPFINAVQQRLG